MGLTARERTRFARHLLLPEIGLSGQERLLRTRVRFTPDADAEVAAVASLYLTRAGLHVASQAVEAASSGEPPAALREGRPDPLPAEPTEGELALALLRTPEVDELYLAAESPHLRAAWSSLAGALGAVEAIKAALGLGTPRDASELLAQLGVARDRAGEGAGEGGSGEARGRGEAEVGALGIPRGRDDVRVQDSVDAGGSAREPSEDV